jgi:predicted RNA-binding protein with PUA-like domain
MQYWLMKSEPSTFGLEQLAAAPRRTTGWDGVRNYQARNMLRDEMKKGDQAFLYHSSTEVPGIVAVMQIVRAAYPDPTAFDRKDHHYDPGSDPENPRWYMVDVQLKPARAHHHSGGAARARGQGTEGHGAPAAGQSSLDHAGLGGALEVHPRARVRRVAMLVRRVVHLAPSTLARVLACNFVSRVYTRSPD